MDLGLKDKRALVLGSTRGIGQGIAGVLAQEGASVAVCGRNVDDAHTVAEEISGNTGATTRSYGMDLTDKASVAALIDSSDKDFNGFDIVINNGGGPPPGGVSEVALEIWEAQYRSLFLSQVQIANAFLPGMRARGWGRILVTASSGTVQPIPHLGISNTLRVALTNWAKTLAGEVAADGQVVEKALAMAREAASMPAPATRMVKEAVNATANALHRAVSYADADQSQLSSNFKSAQAAAADFNKS